MANILIVNNCNLRCPYCFADEKIQNETQLITMKQLRGIITFLKKSGERRIGIIGGEPLLHPEIDKIFKEISDSTRDDSMRSVLFTNGIRLHKHIDNIGRNMSILINVNHPDITNRSPNNITNFNKSLDKVHDFGWFQSGKVTLGINIYPELNDYDFIFQLIRIFDLRKIRVSVVAPTYGDHYKNQEKYYIDMVPKFIEFCRRMKNYNCSIAMDCNRIPICFFTEKESELLNSILETGEKYQHICRPVCDITPDFKIIPCFGTYEEIDMMMFDTLREARDYIFLKKSYPLMQENKMIKCDGCHKYNYSQCHGGCLSFAKQRQNDLLQL